MTRQEALKLLNKHNDDDVANVEVIKQFINQVFDDFESRELFFKNKLKAQGKRLNMFMNMYFDILEESKA